VPLKINLVHAIEDEEIQLIFCPNLPSDTKVLNQQSTFAKYTF